MLVSFTTIALGAIMGLLAIRGLDTAGEQFREQLAATSVELGVDPNHLAAIISFETGGTFSPKIRNPKSGAIGLIQFLPSTARQILGVTPEQLARMTAAQQLPYVAKYLRTVARGRPLANISDFYCAVFAPNFIGAPEDTVLYRQGSKAYEYNKALDRSRDGTITKAEAAAPVLAIYETARARGGVSPKEDTTLPFVLGMQLIRLALKL